MFFFVHDWLGDFIPCSNDKGHKWIFILTIIQTRHAEVTKKREQSKESTGRRRRKICHALQLVRTLRVERWLLIQRAGPLWIINLYMPLKQHFHPQTQNPKVPAGPGASISCSSVRLEWKWECSEDVSSVLRTLQRGRYVKSSPSSLTASPPIQPQKCAMF